MSSWFRSWHGAPTDTKWLTVARRAGVSAGVVSAIAWALFDYASQADDRGSVAGFDAETYAAFSGFDEAQVEAVIAAMTDKGIITADGRLANWEKRQPKREDDSTQRVRDWRSNRVTSEAPDNVTQCNAVQRIETHGNNTDTDTDTDTDVNNHKRADDSVPESKPTRKAATPPVVEKPVQVQVFLDAGGKLPTGKLKDGTPKAAKAIEYIITFVAATPDSLALWQRVVTGYCAQWSALSYTVMVQEYYLKGYAPGEARKGNGNGHSGNGSAGQLGWDRRHAAADAEWRAGGSVGDTDQAF